MYMYFIVHVCYGRDSYLFMVTEYVFIGLFFFFQLKRVWSLCFYGLNLLISGCSDGVVKIWNIRTGKHVKYVQ